MASEEEVIINTRLAGTRQFLADTAEEAAAMEELGVATEETGLAMSRTTRRGHLMNQALFTVRRMMYGTTLATIAIGAAALKMGWNYNTAMQSATVALAPLQSATFNVHQELLELFNFTKHTPFQFKDITIAFRQMYGAMHPLGITASQTNFYIKAMTDALSFAGRTTPAALNRVAVAFQHIAFQGRLTGQGVTQLARDGLPVYAALQKELGLTAEQVHNIGKLGVPAMVGLNAIAKYVETTPGYANAAFNQSTKSLTGIFTTFKDNLSQVMGTVETGFFHRFQADLVGFNSWLNKMTNTIHGGGSFTNVITMLNNSLTPGNNGILLFYQQFIGTLHDLFHAVSNIVSILVHSQSLWTMVYTGLLLIRGAAWFVAQNSTLIGEALKVLIPLWVIYKTVTMAAAIATGVETFALGAQKATLRDLTFAQFLFNLATGRYEVLAKLSAAATWLYTGAQAALMAATESLTITYYQMLIMMETNPLILLATAAIALTAGLVVLYFKWRWFHNEVNSLWHDLIYWSPVVAAALTIAFGPIGAAVTGLLLVIRYWSRIKQFGQGNVGDALGIPRGHWYSQGWLGHKLGLPDSITGWKSPKMPGQASGGYTAVPGWSWVGEKGPELMWMPQGATVLPPSASPVFNHPEGWMQRRQPVVIKVMVGRRQLGQAVAELDLGAQATS